jgi:hypothetical protein
VAPGRCVRGGGPWHEPAAEPAALAAGAYTKAIYAPMIYTALYIMVLMQAGPLLGQVGGDFALEIETFLGPVK